MICSISEKKKVTRKLRLNILKAGTSLNQGQSLMSANKKYEAILQLDGNFVLYENKSDRIKPIWSSRGTKKGNYKLTMRKDGNLVITNWNKKIIWNTKTKGKGKKGHLLFLENDGNLSIYDGKGNQTWSTKTSKKSRKLKKYGTTKKSKIKKVKIKNLSKKLKELKKFYRKLQKKIKLYKNMTKSKKTKGKSIKKSKKKIYSKKT